MALTCRVGTVAAPTTNGGTATISLPAGTDPKRLKLFTSCMTAAGVTTGTGGHARWAEGHVTNDGGSVQQASYAFHSVDDGASTACYRDFSDASALLIAGASTTASEAIATVTTWSDTSIVLTFSTAPTSAYLIGYVVWGGSDIEARVLSFQLSTAVATQDVTVATGWGQPKLVMMLGQNRTTTTLVPVQGNVSVSLGVADGTSARESVWAEQNAAATVIAGAWQRAQLLTVTTDAITVNAEATLSAVGSWPTDGFQLSFGTQAAGAYRVIAVAMKGAFSYTLGSAATNGSAPTLAHSATPAGVEIWSTSTVANAGLDSASTELGGWTFGAGDGTNEVYAGAVDDDANTEASTGSFLKTDKVFGHWQPPSNTANAPTLTGEYDASFTGSGVTLTASTVDSVAREVSYLVLSGTASGATGPGQYGYGTYGAGDYGPNFGAVLPQTYTLTLTATAAAAATVPRQTAARRTGTAPAIGTTIRQAQAARNATAAATATTIRQPRAVRTGTAPATATVAASRVRLATLTATATAAGTLIKRPAKTLTAAAAEAATIVRQTQATRNATAPATGTVVKRASVSRTATASATGTIAVARVRLATLTAVAASVATVVRRPAKTVTAAATAVATTQKAAAKNLNTAAPATGTATAIRVRLVTVTATATTAAALVRQARANRSATATATATLARRANTTRAAAATTQATVKRDASRTITGTAPATATVATVKVKLFSVTATALSAASVARKALVARSVTAPADATVQTPSTRRRTLTAPATATASVTRTLVRTVTASAPASASVSSMRVKLLELTATQGAVGSLSRAVSATWTAIADAFVLLVRTGQADRYPDVAPGHADGPTTGRISYATAGSIETGEGGYVEASATGHIEGSRTGRIR